MPADCSAAGAACYAAGMIDQPHGAAARAGRNCLGPALAALLVLSVSPSALAEGEAPPPLPDWERAFYKTLTFQTAANLADSVLFAVVSGTGAGTGAVFLAANTVTAAALYYPYELAWGHLGPAPADTTSAAIAGKAVGYQALTAGRNLALSYAFTGALLPSAGFVAAAFAVDGLIYVANDLAWDAFRPRAGS